MRPDVNRSAHAGVCARTLVSHEVEMDGCFKGKEHYNHLQPAACNNIHHRSVKTQQSSSVNRQSFDIYRSFYAAILPSCVVLLKWWSVQIVFSTLRLRQLEQT